jgi:hypothetical protein
MRRALALVGAIAALAGSLASGCGGERIVASVVDDAVRVAQRPAVPRPSPPLSTGPIAAPRSALRLPSVRPRPSPVLPEAVERAAPESELVTTFILCDGLGFYLETGALPTAADWPQLFGGYLLSQVPAYRAQEIGDALLLVVETPEPFYEAALLSHRLGCELL